MSSMPQIAQIMKAPTSTQFIPESFFTLKREVRSPALRQISSCSWSVEIAKLSDFMVVLQNNGSPSTS